jgi:uncharacterized protein YcfJ
MCRSGSLFILFAALAACARAEHPVLYPNAHLQQVGREQAERDIEACRTLASDYVEGTAAKDIGRGAAIGAAGGAAIGAVAGAVSGRGAGAGAAIGAATGGTAGVVHGAARETAPSPIYKQFVSRCLHDRGYDVLGWQ